jgi:16S rRNA (adenine(1408)-N(1))-methyltransferase
MGTGTGQAVLRRARREPRNLVIGVDAEAAAMADPSRRAAANHQKGGAPNALFIVESAERLPGPLAGRADLVTVALPWGSLLRGILDPASAVAIGISALLREDGELQLLLSDIEQDAVERLLTVHETQGFATTRFRAATAADVAQLSSGWARRLRIPGRRPAWMIRLHMNGA